MSKNGPVRIIRKAYKPKKRSRKEKLAVKDYYDTIEFLKNLS